MTSFPAVSKARCLRTGADNWCAGEFRAQAFIDCLHEDADGCCSRAQEVFGCVSKRPCRRVPETVRHSETAVHGLNSFAAGRQQFHIRHYPLGIVNTCSQRRRLAVAHRASECAPEHSGSDVPVPQASPSKSRRHSSPVAARRVPPCPHAFFALPVEIARLSPPNNKDSSCRSYS